MQAIDNSNLLAYNANFAKPGFTPAMAYVWDPSAKTVTITDNTARPAGKTGFANIQVHDQYGNTVHGHTATGGTGYTAAPTVTIAAPTSGTTATATSTINSAGQVTGFTITNAGTGYTTAPAITIAAPTTGTTATATAIVTNGTVTDIKLTYGSATVIDVTALTVNKGLSITATITISAGWSATGSAIHISDSSAGGALQDWNVSDSPANAL